MKKKKTKFWIALAVPFAFIALILFKIYHTVDAGRHDPFTNKGGMVFTYEQFTQNIDITLPLTNALTATIRVRENSNILETIEKRRLLSSNNSQYHWLAIGVKDMSNKNWKITFREKGVTPKMECKTRVNIESGVIDDLSCDVLKHKKSL
jgi:hypothetical protein